jgi:hypothetical protein
LNPAEKHSLPIQISEGEQIQQSIIESKASLKEVQGNEWEYAIIVHFLSD